MGKSKKNKQQEQGEAQPGQAAAAAGRQPRLGDFLDFPTLGAPPPAAPVPASAPPPKGPSPAPAPLLATAAQPLAAHAPQMLRQRGGPVLPSSGPSPAALREPPRPAWGPVSAPQPRVTNETLAARAAEHAKEASEGQAAATTQHGDSRGSKAAECPYQVLGSKKGGFPLAIETRKGGKKVTVIRNVKGDTRALLKDLKDAVGAGGTVREGDVEVQGEHLARIEALLVKRGCLKGVSAQNQQAAAPPPPKEKPKERTIARLDKKAVALKQKQ